MPNIGSHARAKCPYFRREKGNAIVCEGATEDSALLVVFEKIENREMYMRCRCECFDYADKCPVAAMLDRKYEKTTEEGAIDG